MKVLLRRSSLRWAILPLAASLAACPADPPAPVPVSARSAGSGAFIVDAFGRGIFAPTLTAGRAWFGLKGNYSYFDDDGAVVTVRGVKIYGAPGLVNVQGLMSHPLAFDPIADLQRPWSTSCQSPWDPKQDTFSLLVKYDYDETVGGVTTRRSAGRWGVFAWIRQSPRIPLMQPGPVGEAAAGDAITTMQAGGTFSGAGGLALYDVHVEWSGIASGVQVYAGPGSAIPPADAAHLVGASDPTNNPPDNTSIPHAWNAVNLKGVFDGTSSQYTLLVKVSWESGSTGPYWAGAFTGIDGDSAITIALE